MKAVNILWDIDEDEAIEKLDSMKAEDAAAALEVPKDAYTNMSSEERHDYAYDYFHHRNGALAEFLELPVEVEIPHEIADDPEYKDNPDWMSEDIANWLSDTYGYCHEGFELKD